MTDSLFVQQRTFPFSLNEVCVTAWRLLSSRRSVEAPDGHDAFDHINPSVFVVVKTAATWLRTALNDRLQIYYQK